MQAVTKPPIARPPTRPPMPVKVPVNSAPSTTKRLPNPKKRLADLRKLLTGKLKLGKSPLLHR